MIHILDSGYLDRPRFAAVYAVQSQGEWALVDSATTACAPRVLDQLRALGCAFSQVRYLVITHVHLDHAGGAARLLNEFPNATVLVQQRGLRHLTDPSRLVQSAQTVYGAENFARLYGEIAPIAANRVRVVHEGERIDLGSGHFEVFETAGHAKHHISLLWQSEETHALFCGDALGLNYPELEGFVLASTSPTDFDPDAARREISRFRHLAPDALYPTHFGPTQGAQAVQHHLELLENWVNGSEKIAREWMTQHSASTRAQAAQDPKELAALQQQLQAMLELLMKDNGQTLSSHQKEFLELDLQLNAQGLLVWAQRSA